MSPTKKQKRPRRAFTPEFKAEAVRIVRTTGKSVHVVARELDLTRPACAPGSSRLGSTRSKTRVVRSRPTSALS
ncbi:MAG: transposase [Myxococcales bacterium]|nr:transposase [Myxococcales bacterium]